MHCIIYLDSRQAMSANYDYCIYGVAESSGNPSGGYFEEE